MEIIINYWNYGLSNYFAIAHSTFDRLERERDAYIHERILAYVVTMLNFYANVRYTCRSVLFVLSFLSGKIGKTKKKKKIPQ